MYLGGMLNGTPTQYVQFSAAGIKLHSPTAVVLEAPAIQLTGQTVEIAASASATVTTPTFTVNGATVLNGTISQTGGGTANFSGSMEVTGDVTAQGTSVHNHVHGGVQPGGGNSGAPAA
jgi:phage gp45-like